MSYDLIEAHIDITIRGPEPVFSAPTHAESELLEQPVACVVQVVDKTIDLMRHDVLKQVVKAQLDGIVGIAVSAAGLVDQHAQGYTAVDRVVVVQVDAADRCLTTLHFDHQAELTVGDQIAVAQQELLNLKQGKRCAGLTDSLKVAIVLPIIDLSGIFRLCRTQRKNVVRDEHHGM